MFLITDEELDVLAQETIEEHEGLDVRDLQDIESRSDYLSKFAKTVPTLGEVARSGMTPQELKQLKL